MGTLNTSKCLQQHKNLCLNCSQPFLCSCRTPGSSAEILPHKMTGLLLWIKDKQAWLRAQPFICFLVWICLCMDLISKGHRWCCWAQQPLSPRGLPASPVRWYCRRPRCAWSFAVPGITSRVTAMCLSLHTGWVMPRSPQLPRQRVAQELCRVLAYALQKSKRAEIRKGKSSLVVAEQFLLTPIYPSWKKTKQNCSKTPIVSIPLSLAFLFWLGAEPHLVPLPSFHSKLSWTTVMAKGGPLCGKDFWRGQWAAPAPGSASEPQSQTAIHLVEITASLQPCSPLLSSPQNSTEEKRNGKGKEGDRKTIVFPGREKDEQLYLAYPALLMSITSLILNRKDTTLVHLFHYLSCYAFPMNCHSCKTCTS